MVLMRMKILHVLDHSIPLHSGYTFRSRSILEHQHKLGWETDHVTSPKHNINAKPIKDEETIDGLHFFRTSPAEGMLARLPVLNQLAIISALEKRLIEIIPKVKPDILHAHSPSLNGRAAINAGKRFGIPVVYEIRAFWEDAAVDHGSTSEGSLRYRLTRAMETSVAKQADAITTICDGLKQDLLQRGIPETKITVIPNAVDIEKFSINQQMDTQLQLKLGLNGKKVIGFIGSFYAYEGLDLLVKAMNLIKNQRNDIVVLLVGGGPQEAHIKQLVQTLNLDAQVIFTGRVPHDDIQRYYDLVDIFAYPRLPMRLTELVTPLKPLEAMAQKKLVIASDVGGHKELIEDGRNGVLFPAGNAAALSQAIIDLLHKEESWEAMRNAGRRYVEDIRNWTNSVANYKYVYPKLVAKND